MKKDFDVIAVASVTTGRLLRDMDDVYEVMDFFCPGIMTMGLVRMGETVAKEIYRQSPRMRSAVELAGQATKENVHEWIEELKEILRLEFPKGTIELEQVELEPA